VTERAKLCTICGQPTATLSTVGRGPCCTGRYAETRVRFCSFCGKTHDVGDTGRSGKGPCCGHVRWSDDVLIHPTLPYLEDIACRHFVRLTKGATLDMIGTAIGLTRERVRQIELAALVKLRRACEREGTDLREILASLSERTGDEREATDRAPPIASGPSEELRAIKEAFVAEEEDEEEAAEGAGDRFHLAHEFYDERNARAMALFNELDLERSAERLSKITARALAIEGVEDMGGINENPWTKEEVEALDHWVKETDLSCLKAAKLVMEKNREIGRRSIGAVTQKILALRRRAGLLVGDNRKRSVKAMPAPPRAPEQHTTWGEIRAADAEIERQTDTGSTMINTVVAVCRVLEPLSQGEQERVMLAVSALLLGKRPA
jgi:hypothetical protein